MAWFDAASKASFFWDDNDEPSIDIWCGGSSNPGPSPFQYMTPTRISKNKWTSDEDDLLRRSAREMRYNWEEMVHMFPGKSPTQISKRWGNKLDPSLTLSKKWDDQEDQLIASLYSSFGGKWQKIKDYLPGRSADMIKSRFHTNIKKKISNNQIVPKSLSEIGIPMCVEPDESNSNGLEAKKKLISRVKTRIVDLEGLISSMQSSIDTLEAEIESENNDSDIKTLTSLL